MWNFLDLALRFGNVVGGLLNATFGNIVEVILSIAALEKGLYIVVATSLVGSVLSNLLLVLGKRNYLFMWQALTFSTIRKIDKNKSSQTINMWTSGSQK